MQIHPTGKFTLTSENLLPFFWVKSLVGPGMATPLFTVRNLCCQTRAADAFSPRRSTKRKFSCTASSNGSNDGNNSSPSRQSAGLNEGVVERLRQAEEEAAKLRAELAEARAKAQVLIEAA